ncbi:MAG: 5-bromo-4-chloroindolyl phosphate hydrolysis family protein [Oscillospiraceae bacterium]|nr:5-bromo-4-chloroindolyl phosphate hydrolysis family protein [Oscillospiraceae bacterium]
MNNNDYNSNNYRSGNSYDTRSPGPGPHTPPPNRQNDDVIDILAWVIDVGLIFACFPIGLVLTICKAVGADITGGILRSITGQGKSAGSNQRAQNAHYTQAEQPRQNIQPAKTSSQPKPGTDGIRHADAGGRPKRVFGWILAGLGAVCLLDAYTTWGILSSIAVILGGGALLFSAHAGRKKEAQFRQAQAVTGQRGIVRIADVIRTLGLKDTEGEKLLSEMIDRGFFGPQAYIDHQRGLLVIRPEDMRDVYRQEDEAKSAREEKARQASQTEYEQYVERLRHADVEIEDEVMSEKIRRMQALTESIFAEVKAHPEKKPQIERFMNYYLPTTLKLLDSYARIEAQGVTGENMAKAKSDIEGIADTLVAGYEKQLDKLYRAEAMDIAGDVSVIENMLRRDGLSGDGDFGQPMGGH